MMGGDIDDCESKGLTPRLVERVFETIAEAPTNLEFLVKVSFMEIYMERIRDLLHRKCFVDCDIDIFIAANENLPINEDKNRGVYVKGLQEVYVSSIQEVYEVMRIGDGSRKKASTNMNEESSRSHSIFVIMIQQKDTLSGTSKIGKLYLVDLAGSEKVGKTGATGQTLEEAKKINRSLTALGMVIHALTDGKSSHIPYRDSKLTRILQESLGGNSKTTLVINCSPSSFNDAETISTLRFGIRAKTIQNRAQVNVELSAIELKILLKKTQTDLAQYQSYTKKLEGELTRWRNGETVPASEFVKFNVNDAKHADGSTDMAKTDKADLAGSKSAIAPQELQAFLDRENELMEELSSKDSELEKHRTVIAALSDEMDVLKRKEMAAVADNADLTQKVSDMQMELDRMKMEQQDANIMVETTRLTNEQLSKKVVDLEADLLALKSAALSVKSEPLEETKPAVDIEKMKQEKTAQMMKPYADIQLSLEDKAIGTTPGLGVQDTSPSSIMFDDVPSLQAEIAKLKEALEESTRQSAEYKAVAEQLEGELSEVLDKAIETEKDEIKNETTSSMFAAKIRQLEETVQNKVKEITNRDNLLLALKRYV
jgi:kinesin family protein 5